MNDYTLAKEFEHYKFLHKSSIVLGCLLKYYNDVANSGVTIPDFMRKSPEEEAKEHYYKLLENRAEFNKMYDKCWEKYGGLLP